ncbi:MAG: DUF1573 domain-containing protein [Patescibacteria group bacterium]|nr:DUF1573 domain-containing protein [Patescibacteria group bacterium]
MNEKKILIVFGLLTFLTLIVGVILLSKSSSPAQIVASKNAKASVDQKDFDWGNIPYGGGNVSKNFTIKNAGTDALKLTNIKTSCHCTQAQVNIDGSLSPYFGMNTVSSWVGEVQPGKEAILTVIFDPSYHGPSGIGPINRFVSVETNDPNNKTLEFNLTGTVVKD